MGGWSSWLECRPSLVGAELGVIYGVACWSIGEMNGGNGREDIFPGILLEVSGVRTLSVHSNPEMRYRL